VAGAGRVYRGEETVGGVAFVKLAERIRRRGPYEGPSSAELIRADRDAR
jgi:hypothetical protein